MGTLSFLASRADTEDDIPSEWQERPAGWSGTPISGGRLGSEYEHHMEWSTPRRRALTISRMIRTSPTIALALDYLDGRVTGCKLHVPRTEQTNEAAAEALEMWLGLGKYADSGGRCMPDGGGMDDLLRHMLSARTYGNCLMAESWQYDKTLKLYFCTLHRRRQESYESYVTEPGTEKLVGIAQQLGYGSPSGADSRLLKLSDSCFIVYRGDQGWWDGKSILRACYGSWRSESLRLRQDDAAANKWSDPPLRAVLDVERFSRFAKGDDGSPITREDYVNEIADLKAKLENLHSEPTDGHIIVPDWWKLEELTSRSGAYDPSPLLLSCQHAQRSMAERLYISWLTQGRAGQGGSRSMVSTQAEVVDDATIDTLQWLLSALNRQTVHRFLRANFAGLKPGERPIVSFERASIKTPWWQTNAQAFAQFVSQSILTVSENDERAIRAASDLPAPPDDSPDALDRQAMQSGGRLKTPAGQREALKPGDSKKKANTFVDRLVERGDEE